MTDEDDFEMHSTRAVRTDGDSVVVTIPPSAVDHSGIEVGENVMVGSEADGTVVLVPWGEEDVEEIIGRDE